MPTRTVDTKGHTDLFARAIKSFSAGDYRKARSLFDEASNGPVISVNESARMYMRMCDQRLKSEKLEIKTPEEHYDYAVKLLNDGKPADAVSHLRVALQAPHPSGHVHYALALALGQQGDMGGAHQHLKTAVELDPALKSFARGDADFRDLLQDAALRELVVPERTPAAAEY
jgi:tetratricopeptide (TPR) repeat protein